MFFRKFFSKDGSQLKDKGDKLFAAGHFADARNTYEAALEQFDREDSPAAERAYVCSQISKAANKLAEINLSEAETAFRLGDIKKGSEHLQLSLELADDVRVREKAEFLLANLENANDLVVDRSSHQATHACASCATSSPLATELSDPATELPDDEQFQLLVNALPGNLPQRYGQLGEKFAIAYLFAHKEMSAEALTLIDELLSAGENDILLYEAALLHFRSGDAVTCEQYLRRAMQIEVTNPLCHLGLAQLYVDTGRYGNALEILETMIARDILLDHALIMSGDVHMLQGEQSRAIEVFTAALNNPGLRKIAAERLVTILGSQGRDAEANYLIKTYLKGCC